jgi:hypothetical protein
VFHLQRIGYGENQAQKYLPFGSAICADYLYASAESTIEKTVRN